MRFGLIATLAADAAELVDAPRGSRVLETIVVTDACRGVLPGLLALGWLVVVGILEIRSFFGRKNRPFSGSNKRQQLNEASLAASPAGWLPMMMVVN